MCVYKVRCPGCKQFFVPSQGLMVFCSDDCKLRHKGLRLGFAREGGDARLL